jgi:hypothetical protein
MGGGQDLSPCPGGSGTSTPGAAWWEWHAAGKCSVPSRHHLQPNQVLPDDRIGLYSSVSAPLHSTLSLTYLGS